MTKLSVEEEYNITLPALYKQLFAEGMLDCVDIQERIKYPRLLGMDFDFRPLDISCLDALIYDVDLFYEDYFVIPELKLIPFATNDNADRHYCFYFNEQQNNDVPIVYLDHEYSDGIFLTKNLEDFIFYGLLKLTLDIIYPAFTGDLKTNLFNMLSRHKNYLTEERYQLLEEIYKREVYTTANDEKAILNEAEFNQLLQQYAPYERYKETFEYVRTDDLE